MTTLSRIATKQPHIITLMIVSAFAAMGAIIMMPALPQISNHFHVRPGVAQLAVTLFLAGYALGQLIYGPIANRFGRKFAIHIGIVIASIGSIFSILSAPTDSFSLLIVGRFLEAIGSSAGFAISITMIHDYYYENDARRIMGFLMFAFAIIPGIAITLGGFLVQYLHWQSCFYFLLFYGLLLIYPAHQLPETNLNPDHDALKYKKILHQYRMNFHSKKLVLFAAIAGFSAGCIYVFGAQGPFIGIHLLHTPPAIYGLLALLPYLGTVLGSIIAIKFAKHNAKKLIQIAFLIELIAAVVMLLFFASHHVSLYTLLIPMGFLCIGNPMIGATAISISAQSAQDKGSGTAVTNFVLIALPVLMTFLLSLFHLMHSWVMPAIFLVAILAMIVIFSFLKEQFNHENTSA